MSEPYDCLIVGGGPAGLTAAIYAARFRLSVAVIDAGASRAALIPRTRNHAGFPDGIAGRDLIDRMRIQAARAGAQIRHGEVTRLAVDKDGLRAESTLGPLAARAMLLATGVANSTPAMAADLRSAAITAGRLRYCPVCDGFEVMDQNVAVIGSGARGVKEALFLRGYTRRVTLVSNARRHTLTARQRGELLAAGVEIAPGPVSDFQLKPNGLAFQLAGGRRSFEAVYPALGSTAHSVLARRLGAHVSAGGCIKVDAHQRTSLRRLYAAGDVVIGLDQISHAMGEAGVAATTIRNDLASEKAIRR